MVRLGSKTPKKRRSKKQAQEDSKHDVREQHQEMNDAKLVGLRATGDGFFFWRVEEANEDDVAAWSS